jgi:branched-chain amino acid transport system ATP-binding protein
LLNGQDLSEFPPHELVSHGISMVPEGRGIFSRLTVYENLEMGAYSRTDRDAIDKEYERVYTLFPRLKERNSQVAGTLNQEGTTVLLVEQNALMALQIADRGYVLQTGEIVLHDTADNLRKNPIVQKAYLGID